MSVMKQRSTTPVSKRFTTRVSIVVAALLVATAGSLQMFNMVYADTYDDQIAALKRQISGYQDEANKLNKKADTLQNALNKLTVQRNALQVRINESEVKYKKLKSQIKKTEADIATNKEALGDTLTDIYVEGDVSPIVMIAGSDNISETLNNLEYHDSVRDQLVGKIQEIKDLKEKLEKQKVAVEQVLADQKTQRKQLLAKEAERRNLIAQTRGQESAYHSLMAKNNSQISKLRQEQAAYNARFTGGGGYAAGSGPACGGSYPGKWCNIPMDVVTDDWGMFNRECVSYTAWKVHADYLAGRNSRDMPYWGGIGNAYQWDDNARNAGIPVNSTPAAGAIAQTDAGPYGHVMYVESVNGNGTINISQYNVDFSGTYSYVSGISPAGLNFIHFP